MVNACSIKFCKISENLSIGSTYRFYYYYTTHYRGIISYNKQNFKCT